MDTSHPEQAPPPELYDKKYYLTDNEGCWEFQEGLDAHVHPKFVRALKLAPEIKPGVEVLDVGCGRGELLYYCAQKGARATGIDYSPDAVALVQEKVVTLLPADRRSLVRVACADIAHFSLEGTFDVFFVVEVLEHLTDSQIRSLLEKARTHLKPSGRLIVTTPNVYYERYLSPIKRLLDTPFRLLRELFRVARGKSRAKNAKDLWKRIFRIRVSRGQQGELMHVNVMTPSRLRRLLKDFDAEVVCEDPSKNPISLLLRRWWGRNLVAVAKNKTP
jgi:2-polyprenyl-3-methyl-5-hydroxy-6-metoxy-1,4-benzoquinol methylase